MISKVPYESQRADDARVFGLIGYPLTHSFSKKYFTEKFARENIAAVYENFPLQSVTEFPSLAASQIHLAGLNVTIPYKIEVIKYLDELDETASEAGAVNTIRLDQGKMRGFNTDVYGFMQSIMKLLEPQHTSALILGTGGSSRAVAYGLKKLGIDFSYVSRKGSGIDYADINPEIMAHHKLIINCTPVGMFPEITNCPVIPYEMLTAAHLLFDLIYNPEETLFLRKGKQQGAQTSNGLEMLQLQAERSWEIWNL